MSLSATGAYVKTEDNRIYVRGSCYANWSINAFSADEALQLAAQLVSAANSVNGSKGAVTVTLARDEAEALAAVLNRVGGDPKDSPRGKTTSVAGKLKTAGVTTPGHKLEAIAGGLWFRNYDGKPINADLRETAERVFGLAEDLGLA